MATIYRQFLFVLLCFSRKLCLRAFRPMDYIFFLSGSVCYCLALKSKKWSIIYFKSDVKFFPWHIIRLNFITWFVCVFFVCFHVQINLKTVCILHKTMMTDSPITKSILRNMSFFTLIYNLCRKKVLLLYLGPWLPSRLGNLWLVTCTNRLTSIAQRANIFSVMIWPNTDNQFDSCSLMSFDLPGSYSRQVCLRPFWRM